MGIMANTIDRAYPGDLGPGNGLTFRSSLNADREKIYSHTEALEKAIEVANASYFGKGTIPGNTAELYINNPTSGKVYCPVGYKAIIGGVAIETTAILEQAFTTGSINHVFLVVLNGGTLSLRVSTSATENANDLWIADVTATPEIDNNPSGKAFADIIIKGSLIHQGSKLGFFNTSPVAKTSVADPAAFGNADGEIGNLTLSASYTQSEVQALRDKCEELADDCRGLQNTVATLINVLQGYGLV